MPLRRGRTYPWRLLRAAVMMLGIAVSASAVHAIGASLDLPGKTAEEGTAVVKRSLKRLNTDCVEMDITLGSNWRCKTPFFSLVSLDIFVSTIPEKTVIRADSRNRQSYAFIDLVSNELGQPKYDKTYGEKSLLLTAGATLISPALGYWYVNSNSMIKNKSIFLPFLGFLAGDLALFWVSSKIYFTNGFDPFNVGLTSMLISMGTYRAVMLVPFSIQVMAHNRFVGLQITFRY
ncbi:MAG: hypothetical protein JNJ69_08125 [Leptospiraceae bacterium]|nr:hypothetical protein [Leptospiraceae bacterium]